MFENTVQDMQGALAEFMMNLGGHSSGWGSGENSGRVRSPRLACSIMLLILVQVVAVSVLKRNQSVWCAERRVRCVDRPHLDSALASSFTRSFHSCMSPIDRDRCVRCVARLLHGCCTSHAAHGGTISCGVVHDNSSGARTKGIHVINVVGVFLRDQSRGGSSHSGSSHFGSSGDLLRTETCTVNAVHERERCPSA